jgi:hypothetical protein
MQNGLYAKIHLLTPIDPQTSTFTIGVERIIKRIGIEAAYGHATRSLFSPHDGTYKNHYWELRGESRFYFYRKTMFDQKIWFCAVEYIYLPRSYTLFDNWYYAIDGNIYHYDVSSITDNRNIVATKMGRIINPLKNFYIEFFAGMGLQFLNLYHHPQNTTLLQYAPFQEWFQSADKIEGKLERLHISLGIKVNYKIY